MSSPQTTDSPQVRLAREWIDGFGNKDLVFVAKDLHKDFRYAVYPRSLGKPETAREEWLQEVRKVFSFWVSNEVSCGISCSIPLSLVKRLSQITYHSIIDAPGNVVVHVRVPNAQAGTVCAQLIMCFV